VATAVSRHCLGNSPAFSVPAYRLASALEFPIYSILGILCALVGVLFTTTLYKAEDAFESLKFPEYLKAALGGTILGGMALLFPHVLGVGYGSIYLSLTQTLAWWVMLLLILSKLLATSITIGSGGSGGIFAPSLFLGAMTGGFFGAVVHHLLPGITAPPGAYSIVGMGAVVSATTHGPLTAILILFEMTGDYKIILPLMITCIISYLASSRLLEESIYTMKLVRRGLDIKAGKEVNVLKSIPVKDVMTTEVEAVAESMSLRKLSDRILRSKYKSFPVINEKGNLTGILSFFDYADVLFDENLKDLLVAKDLATSDVIKVSADENLLDAFEKITMNDFSILPVVSPHDSSRLIGVLTRRDIIGAYDKAVIKKSLFSTKN
jgi:CIC family chloride channel protein